MPPLVRFHFALPNPIRLARSERTFRSSSDKGSAKLILKYAFGKTVDKQPVYQYLKSRKYPDTSWQVPLFALSTFHQRSKCLPHLPLDFKE